MAGVDILIPCYNEERNIGYLLKRICNEVKAFKLDVERILIANSGSDRSQEIIDRFSSISPLEVRQYVFERRLTAVQAFNFLLSQCQNDIFWINADVDFADGSMECLLREAYEDQSIGITCPRMCPTELSKRTIIGKALVFGAKLTDLMRQNGKWILIGRFFFAKKKVIDFKIPETPIEPDSYIFFKVLEKQRKVIYVPQAICYHTVPLTWPDFVKSNYRFERGQRLLVRLHPEWTSYRSMVSVNKEFITFLAKLFVRDPLPGFVWATIKAYFRLLFNFNSAYFAQKYDVYSPAGTTKIVHQA